MLLRSLAEHAAQLLCQRGRLCSLFLKVPVEEGKAELLARVLSESSSSAVPILQETETEDGQAHLTSCQ